MTQWTYLLLMNPGVHAEMRVFQVVDNQQVSVIEFFGRRSGNLLKMTILIEVDESKARRIEALLSRLQSILRVDCFAFEGTSAAEEDHELFQEGAD